MKCVNLTPHPVRIVTETRSIVIPPSGMVARVREETEIVGKVVIEGEAVPVVVKGWGQVEGLPEKPEEGVIYIVSALVLSALKGDPFEKYALAPDTGPDSVIRDGEGRIVGVRRLMCL